MELKPKSPKKSRDDSENMDDWLLESNVDYNLLTESGSNFQLLHIFLIVFLEKLSYKLAKNRESARNSRKRKKVYFEMLEAKVIELSDELAHAKKRIKQLEESHHQIGLHSKFVIFKLKSI